MTVAPAKISKELRNKTILVTGGAGSIGSHLVKRILNYPVRTVRVLDINEHALFRLKKDIRNHKVRFLLGSILDKDRLKIATDGVDIIIHAAAIKNIEISEYNPIETIDVNINGTVNLIKIVITEKPKKFINISTDKAVEPSTLYGTTKQLSERLTSWAGKHMKKPKFSSVRIGNVMDTRGGVMEIWNEEAKNKEPLSITDPDMKRFFFSKDEASDFILECLTLTNRGEIFVPKMKSYKIKDLAMKISKNHKVIGKRQGEKIEELLISESEKKYAKELKHMWVIDYYL